MILWLFIGYPLEFVNLSAERFVAIFFFFFIVPVILLLFLNIIKIKEKIIRIATLTTLICISLIYSWAGLWTFIISSDKGPIWVDKQVYTNQKGDKVICIDNKDKENFLELGKIYTVQSPIEEFNKVQLKELSGWYFATRFKHVPKYLIKTEYLGGLDEYWG